ncbi:hypothetical protein AHAS_Ahas01G0178100 [Arachis hypogaea]
MEFLIQLHGFPEDHMRDETTMVVGNMVGLVSEIEDPLVDGVLMRNYQDLELPFTSPNPCKRASGWQETTS